MDRYRSVRELQLDSLQTHLNNLTDEYQATTRQFDCTLSGIDRENLEAQLGEIDRQMSEVEREIKSLT